MASYDILYSRLTTHDGLSALISDRAYPLILPQAPTLPAVVYQLVSRVRFGQSVKLYRERYQVTCWAQGYIRARDVADQVHSALIGYTDTDGAVVLKGTIEDNDIEVYDPLTDTWGVVLDFILTIAN